MIKLVSKQLKKYYDDCDDEFEEEGADDDVLQ